ncbi:MAG: hypothetical protein KJ621_14025 [Proteobacteria bacterium]|nr:hypothetical protein [Pseudomonadota bacterium]MBU1740995.1 hypothetical protein [Pseudomonadota bacterium]
MVLDVTAKTTDGRTIFTATRVYMPQSTDGRGKTMTEGPTRKLGLIRDTSLQPFAPKVERFQFQPPPGVVEIILRLKLSYRPRPQDVYPIHDVTRKVSVDR